LSDIDMPSVVQALRAADAAGNTQDATRLAQIAQQGLGTAPAPATQSSDAGPHTFSGTLDAAGQLASEAGKGALGVVEKGAAGAAGFVPYAIDKFNQLIGNTDKVNPADDPYGPPLDSSGKAVETAPMREQLVKWYQKFSANHPDAVPSYKNIHNAFDAALYATHAAGAMLPYAGAAALGGVPAIAALGAADSGETEAEQPNSTTGSIATAAGLGGAEATLPVPFLKSGGNIASKLARGALISGPLYGAVTGATSAIPRAVASGDPEDAIPSSEQLINSILGGSIGLGTFGAAHGAYHQISGEPAPAALPPSATPQQHADARIADRINNAAEQNRFNLNKVSYSDKAGAKRTLDEVSNQLAEEQKSTWKTIQRSDSGIDPATISNVNDLLDRTALNASIRSAKNKVKGRVGDDDLQTLQDAVGHTQEGQVLVDLVRQSNALTDLFSGGLKGGLSRYTDY
jgi:hypothetical protein